MINIFINNDYENPIKIFELDNRETILMRISGKLNTIPKYLYFKEENFVPLNKNLSEGKNIIVRDILSLMVSTTDFISLYNEIKNLRDWDITEDLVYPYLALKNAKVKNVPSEHKKLMLLSDIQRINKKIDVNASLDKIPEDFIETKNNLISKNKNRDKINLEQFAYFNGFNPVNYTKFEMDRIQFWIMMDYDNSGLLDLFNLIRLTSRCPFANTGKYYKIYRNFIPPMEWSGISEEYILLKINTSNTSPDEKNINYSDIFINISENQIIFNIDVKLGTKTISLEELIKSVINIFPTLGTRSYTIKQKNIKGIFYIPNFNINTYLLADLIMNNFLFSSMFVVEESNKPTKKNPNLYITFENEEIGRVSFFCHAKNYEKTDTFDNLGEPNYLRIRISYIDSDDLVPKFQNIFAKFLSLYKEESPKILRIYQKYIKSFKENQLPKPKKIKSRPQDRAPEIFVKNYARKCSNEPTIIGDEDIEKFRTQGYQILTYPKTKFEGLPIRNYICKHQNEKYPGLQQNPNTLSNKDLVKYLPCCFKTIQNPEDHPYFNENKEIPTNIEQQNIITTNKFLGFNVSGNLPANILSIFELDRDINFLRKGVKVGESSLLECVLEALNKITNIPQEERKDYLNERRQELANFPNAAILCRQEMFDFNTEDILNMIRNPTVYLDPKYFINLLEQKYKCNIYIFNRSRDSRDAELVLPRFINGYYKNWKPDFRTIIIYQHMGNTSSKKQDPPRRCELIIRWNKKTNEIKNIWDPDTELSNNLKTLFDRVRKSYVNNVNIIKKQWNPPQNLDIKYQKIDSSGKTRILFVKYNNTLIKLLVPPTQPLNYPELSSPTRGISAEIIEDFLKSHNIPHGGRENGNYKVKISSMDIVIPSGEDKKNNNEINNFRYYQKLARYISEYFRWLYSNYMFTNSLQHSDETLNNFVKEKIIIKPEYIYEHEQRVPQFYTNSENGIMENQKLILKSGETLNRLVYSLKLFARQKEKLINYHQQTKITDYYLNLHDFDKYNSQIILEGQKSLESFIILEKKIKKNYLWDKPQPQLEIPYFLRIKKITGAKIVLAQNISDLKKALNIIEFWKLRGYNPSPQEISTELPKSLTEFELFTPETPPNSGFKKYILRVINNTIQKIQSQINETPRDLPKLIGYRMNQQIIYTILLN